MKEELAEKLGITDEELNYVITNYESLDNFKNAKEISEKDSVLKRKIFRKIVDIDLFDENNHYENLACAIMHSGEFDDTFLMSSKGLNEALETLTDNEKYVIEHVFGLNGNNQPETFEKVGELLGESSEKVNLIFSRSLKKLRKPSRSSKIFYNLNDTELLTEEEVELINKLKEKLLLSDIKYSNIPYSELQVEEIGGEILNVFEFLKNRNLLIEQRKIDNLSTIGEMSIDELGLSTKTYNILRRGQVQVIDNLIGMNEQELRSLRFFSDNDFEQIIEKLEGFGIGLVESDGIKEFQIIEEKPFKKIIMEKRRLKGKTRTEKEEELKAKMQEDKELDKTMGNVEALEEMRDSDKSVDTIGEE